MLHFLRRIRRSLIGTGTTSKYLLYAVGEILLVMIGILLALQVNNWNEENIHKKDEIKLLNEIRITIQDDLVDFEERFALMQNVESRIQTLLYVLKSNDRPDTIDVLCGAVYGILRFELNTASFEELKSSGFDLISDDSIRRLIIKIYDKHLKTIDHYNSVEDNVVLEALRPYFLKNFTDIRFLESAQPKDLDLLYEDDYYHNIVDYRLTVLRTLSLDYYPHVISDIHELLKRIDDYLPTE